MYASTGFTPAARTRTTTSPAPAFGSGTSSSFNTAAPPNSCTRIAFIVFSRSAEAVALRAARLKLTLSAWRDGFSRAANAIMGTSMQLVRIHKTVGVKVGHVQVGGGAP